MYNILTIVLGLLNGKFTLTSIINDQLLTK